MGQSKHELFGRKIKNKYCWKGKRRGQVLLKRSSIALWVITPYAYDHDLLQSHTWTKKEVYPGARISARNVKA